MKVEHKSDPINRRMDEYPPLSDQLDLLYKGFQETLNRGQRLSPSHQEWVEKIKEIKDKYPKNSS